MKGQALARLFGMEPYLALGVEFQGASPKGVTRNHDPGPLTFTPVMVSFVSTGCVRERQPTVEDHKVA